MHARNLTMTLEEGRMRTCLFPRFSALVIVFRQSASTDIRTIFRCRIAAEGRRSGAKKKGEWSNNTLANKGSLPWTCPKLPPYDFYALSRGRKTLNRKGKDLVSLFVCRLLQWWSTSNIRGIFHYFAIAIVPSSSSSCSSPLSLLSSSSCVP